MLVDALLPARARPRILGTGAAQFRTTMNARPKILLALLVCLVLSCAHSGVQPTARASGTPELAAADQQEQGPNAPKDGVVPSEVVEALDRIDAEIASSDPEAARTILEDAAGALAKLEFESESSSVAALTALDERASTLGHLELERLFREGILETWTRLSPEGHPKLLDVRGTLAATVKSLGHLDDALVLQEEVLEARRRQLSDEHPDVLNAKANLAVKSRALGET